MIRIKFYLLVLLVFASSSTFSQTTDISGQVKASANTYGIHIINKSSNKFTITDDDGKFVIPARLYDTILVSGVQYKLNEFVVNDIIMQTKNVIINLEDKVNELDEVIVGKILTGDLLSDIENSEVKRDINFYDVGIPGYTGRRKTQTERRIYEATTGSGLVPLNPILNWISGRTKRLNQQLARERQDKAVQSVASKFSKLLFEETTLTTTQQNEFFYFCGDDIAFMPLYRKGNELKMLQFLQQKLILFKTQIEKE